MVISCEYGTPGGRPICHYYGHRGQRERKSKEKYRTEHQRPQTGQVSMHNTRQDIVFCTGAQPCVIKWVWPCTLCVGGKPRDCYR